MKNLSRLALFSLLAFSPLTSAIAMDLDWGGTFSAESVMINSYAPNQGSTGSDGYDVISAGSKNARFQTLFLRLQPKLIVNDNVSIKTEWWLGNPVTGFYGVDYPGGSRADQGYYNSTFNGGSTVSAQRFWAEFLTDIGTLQVGRAPQNWGLGVLHNAGDGPFDRYQSTGDTIRMISKFGNFSLIPAFVKYDFGNAAGGTCVGNAPCTHPVGGATLSEYMLGLQYENKDEDFEGGLNFIRRVAGAQTESGWINGVTNGGMGITIWDVYAKKKMGKFDLGLEAPVFNGMLTGLSYKAFALAGELNYQANDSWKFFSKFGKVPGQSDSMLNNGTRGTSDKWEMVYFHPSYKLGLIMFNYNFGNFSGNNNPNDPSAGPVKSIYDNPITNANYLMLGTAYTADKWRFSGSFITAKADRTASAGQYFFNTWTRQYSSAPATKDQGSNLGSEIDLGVALNWDEFTTFSLDGGLWFPGAFYKFSNGTVDNDLSTVFAGLATVAIKF